MVRLKFAWNHHWNLYFHYENSVTLTQIYRISNHPEVVPNKIEICAMANLKAFLQKKNIFAGQSFILASLGTLTDVTTIVM